MKAREAVETAKQELVGLTGLEVETVSAVNKEADNWVVQVDMVELRMVPNTRDVLAVYEVVLSVDGDLLSYRRLGRYQREQLEIAHE